MEQLIKSVAVARFFFARYPIRGLLSVFAILVAGLSEVLGIAALLPLLTITIGKGDESRSMIVRWIEQGLQSIGLQPEIGVLLSIIVLLFCLKALLMLLAMSQVGYTIANVTADLQLRLMRALMVTEWCFMVNRKSGYLTNAVASETAASARCFRSFCQGLATITQVAAYVLLALLISWEVALAALGVGVISFVLLWRFIRVSHDVSKRHVQLLRSFVSRLVETLSAIKPIRSMGLEGGVFPLLEGEIRELQGIQKQLILNKELMTQLQLPIRAVGIAMGLYVLLTVWEQQVGTVFVLAVLFWRTVTLIGGVQNSVHSVMTTQPSFWLLRQTIEEAEAARETDSAGIAVDNWKELSLRQVYFSYGSKNVLRGASMTVRAGQFVAVAGPSGIGKTTVADLIIGLLQPTSGAVMIDNVPLGSINRRQWRQRIGYVPQETLLFHDTIKVNVAVGDYRITDIQVEQALWQAGAREFVAKLPDGIQTIVGERGAKLSGGERQRIAIARALVRNPNLLILDEATSSLDPETEWAICETLKELKGRVTILAISHQPALRSVAEVVYRIEDGLTRADYSTGEQKARAV